jgi:hypothetical protein
VCICIYIYIIYVNIGRRKIKHMFTCRALRYSGMWRCVAGSVFSTTPKKSVIIIFKCSKSSCTSESLRKKVVCPFETSASNNLTTSQKTEVLYYIPVETLKAAFSYHVCNSVFLQLQNKHEAFCGQTVSNPPPQSNQPTHTLHDKMLIVDILLLKLSYIIWFPRSSRQCKGKEDERRIKQE